MVDYEKAFSADPDADIFELRDIDRVQGCVVITHPDQFVAEVVPLDDHAALTGFFSRVGLSPVPTYGPRSAGGP